MVRARVQAGLGAEGPRVEMVTGDDLGEDLDLLLVDLNRESELRLGWLGRVASIHPGTEVICFGRHTELANLSPAAKAAGADRCVANSHMAETLQRWLRSGRTRRHPRGEQPRDQL